MGISRHEPAQSLSAPPEGSQLYFVTGVDFVDVVLEHGQLDPHPVDGSDNERRMVAIDEIAFRDAPLKDGAV
jgi:hypothetical protein